MKKYLLIIGIILIPVVVYAWGIGLLQGGSGAVDLCDSCEVGFDSGDPDGAGTEWVSTGDWGNTTPAMCGAQNVLLDITEYIIFDPNYAASEMWFRFAFQFADEIDADEFYMVSPIDNGLGATAGYIGVDDVAGVNYLSCTAKGGSTVNSSAQGLTLVAGTTYWVTAYFKVDSGATDGTATAWVYIDGAWVQVCTVADGNDSTSIDAFQFTNSQNLSPDELQYFDCFSDSTTAFGDLP